MNGARSAPAAAVTGAWTAVILGGSRPDADPLAARFGVASKALLPVGGEPMIGRVARTLLRCDRIARVLLLVPETDLLGESRLAWLVEESRVKVAASGPNIAGSLADVLGTDAAPWPVLVTTADHPLLTPQIIDHFLSASAGSDASLGVVEQSLLLARFPGSRRTWFRLADGAYTGANLFTLQGERAWHALGLFRRTESHRKRRLRLLWQLGPLVMLGAALRLLSLEKGFARISRRLGIRITPVPLPFPEAGVDVDRAEDHVLAERILGGNGASGGAESKLAVSIFDLDRTLTRRGTFTAFLLYATGRQAPWRLLLAPAAIVQFARYAARRITRKRLKERLQSLFLGAQIPRDRIAGLAEDFARRLRGRGFNRQGLAQIEEERRQGRRIILATAANAFYAEAIARELAVDELVCTQSAWEVDALVARIEGPNCYGEDKLAMLRAHLERPELPRSAMHVRFFSDHRSDACVMHWADQVFVVNPERRFGAYARGRGWAVLRWS